MQKYLILYNRTFGVTNESFYRNFYKFEFIAANDQDALNKVKVFQKECENNQEKSGVDLCAFDPDLLSGLYKFNIEDDDFSIKIEQ